VEAALLLLNEIIAPGNYIIFCKDSALKIFTKTLAIVLHETPVAQWRSFYKFLLRLPSAFFKHLIFVSHI
jgi:hypothetical protein